MDKLNQARLYLSVFLTAASISAARDMGLFITVKNRWDSIYLACIGIFLSLIVTPMIIKIATNSRLFRKFIFKGDWIEGYWHNVFIELDDDKKRPFHSITEIAFRNSDLGYHTIGYRIVNGEDYYNFSQYVVLLGESNFFFNYALSNANGPFRSVVSCGYFYKSPGSHDVNTFEGVITYPDGEKPYKLRSKKISARTIKKLRKDFGDDWMKEFLKCNEYKPMPPAIVL